MTDNIPDSINSDTVLQRNQSIPLLDEKIRKTKKTEFAMNVMTA